MSHRMSSLFLISFLVYLFSLAFTEAGLAYKLLILFRDLMVLALVSSGFNWIRKHAVMVLVSAILLYAFVQIIGFNLLYNTFPEVSKSEVATDDTFELLIETPDGNIPRSYSRLIEKYHLTIQPAFEVSDPSISHLDEFLVAGIPDASEDKMPDIIRDLKRLKGTQYVEFNETVQVEDEPAGSAEQASVSGTINDPLVGQQWGWSAIQGDRLYEVFKGQRLKPKKRALIAIVDSGVEAGHEDLASQFLSSGSSNDIDPLGHGTHCAGIAAAVSNNGLGIASLVPDPSYVQVTSIRVMNASGFGNEQTIIQGVIKAADAGADVISLSLGSLTSDSRQRAYDEAVKYANAKGAIVVASAGNSSRNAKGYSPANAKGIIAVSALGTDMRKAPFSNTVNDLTYGIAAPGMKIMSTYPGKQYKELDGTSMAAPMVAGLIGMLKAFRPELTTAEVYDILNRSGKTLADGKSTGKLIQAADALEMVLD